VAIKLSNTTVCKQTADEGVQKNKKKVPNQIDTFFKPKLNMKNLMKNIIARNVPI